MAWLQPEDLKDIRVGGLYRLLYPLGLSFGSDTNSSILMGWVYRPGIKPYCGEDFFIPRKSIVLVTELSGKFCTGIIGETVVQFEVFDVFLFEPLFQELEAQ